MNDVITFPSEGETLLIESLYHGIKVKNYDILKSEIMRIPKISTLERVNFYLFNKYATTLIDGIETFEEKLKEELRDTCLKIKKFC